MKSNEAFLLVSGLVLVSLVFFLSTNIRAAQTAEAASNVTIQEYVAIGLSNNLTMGGIQFGTINPSTTDNNATGNYNSTLVTQYYVNISTDSNVNVDVCIKDNASLTFGAYTIENGNYTWNETSVYGTYDNPQGTGYVIATTYQLSNSTNIAPGGVDYFRFWLDVPSGQPAGTYYNTVSFKGVKTGTGC